MKEKTGLQNIFSSTGINSQRMGNALARLFRPGKQFRGLMLGLDNAGKTTILYRFKDNQTVQTIPTIGFNCEVLNIARGVRLQTWDVGGQDRIRRLWRHYYAGNHALVWVVDASDTDRLEESTQELHEILSDELLADAVLLVLANKHDLVDTATLPNLVTSMRLHTLPNRQWHIEPTVATRGEGLREGFEWLAKAIKNNKGKTSKR